MQKIINLEHKLGIKRRIPDQFDHLYGSTQWFSITYEATKAIIHYTSQHPSFYHRARWTFAAEEYYIATVLVNIVGKSRIVPSDLRFIIWREENGNCPANLGMKHFHALASSKDFYFARKMEYPICADLVHNIDTYLLKQSAYEVTKTGGWRYDGLMRYSYDYNILREIYKTCRSLKILNVLDIGCGAGFYTAALRKRGIPTAGYDANPYTPKSSSLLLPKNDELCGVADLTLTLQPNTKSIKNS